MPDQRLTPAQLKALEAIETGRVSQGTLTGDWWNHSTSRYMYGPTIRVLVERSLVATLEGAAYLTDAGRRALEHHRSQR
jgi:hypothetical protein